MTRACLITITEHAKWCVETYLEFLKGEMSESDYVICINSHSQLTNERLYRYYEQRKAIRTVDEFNYAKSQVAKTHSKYLRSTNHV